jgi:GTP pyrophosphokinase
MQNINKLLSFIENYNPNADIETINKAFEFANIAHLGQKRLSGDPYITHPFAVAQILADYKMDSVSIIVGLLHDVIEDTEVTYEEIAKRFGKEVAELVDGVTKVGSIKLQGSGEEVFVENLRKMLLAMSKDLRVIMVKLADRYHNLQTLQYLPQEKQKRIAKSTLDIYAPLAERLGMGEMKGNLEDLSFPYAYPEEYKWLIEYSRPYYKKAEEFLNQATRFLYKELAKEKIKGKVTSRSKHLYSLWRKLQRPEIDRDINKVYDLVAMRVLVDNIKDCYASLGIIHSFWRPIPAVGIRDFIAQPKPNGYRSIHTTVFSLKGRIAEVQIRTFQMHEEAEHGVAAHWYYSEQKARGLTDRILNRGLFIPVEKITWVKQLVSWQKQIVDSSEFLNTLKFDGLADRIYVFSPLGDVYDLPIGSTSVDFAYGVHTKLGNEIIGSKVNGKMVSLDFKLKSGDMVEIIKKEGGQPSSGWLEFVVTSLAKREINKCLRIKEQKEEKKGKN